MHDDEAPHRVLRIPMPVGKKECFIAISFDRALDQVLGAIAEAVSSHGFKFNRVDLSRPGPKSTENNVPEGIRNAAVVVAVVNNKEGDSSRINANVAYELGLAHALGKPVMIIVDDIRNTPFSDIGHFHWIESHPGGEFRRGDFIAHLKNALTNVMNQSYSQSHPLWPEATLDQEDVIHSTLSPPLTLAQTIKSSITRSFALKSLPTDYVAASLNIDPSWHKANVISAIRIELSDILRCELSLYGGEWTDTWTVYFYFENLPRERISKMYLRLKSQDLMRHFAKRFSLNRLEFVSESLGEGLVLK